MKEDLIADLWIVVVEHIPEKQKKDVAADFVNTLIDHGVKDSILDSLLGVDPFLDTAIEYATDGDDYSEDEETYDYNEDED
jgi:hypothetical protein